MGMERICAYRVVCDHDGCRMEYPSPSFRPWFIEGSTVVDKDVKGEAHDVALAAYHDGADFDDPNMNNPSAWDLASDQLVALEAAGFRVIRPDPDLAERLREWAGPPYCADDEPSAEDMRLAAALIDTDTGRTDHA